MHVFCSIRVGVRLSFKRPQEPSTINNTLDTHAYLQSTAFLYVHIDVLFLIDNVIKSYLLFRLGTRQYWMICQAKIENT